MKEILQTATYQLGGQQETNNLFIFPKLGTIQEKEWEKEERKEEKKKK